MKAKIDVLRAVMATVGRRALILTALVIGVVLLSLLTVIWALAHFISSWWWLLLIGYVPLLTVCVGLLLLARALIRRLYPKQLSRQQKSALSTFTDKIQRLLETRGIGWPFFALLNVKDLIFHRELRTTKHLISDTASLRKDFAELEKKLQS